MKKHLPLQISYITSSILTLSLTGCLQTQVTTESPQPQNNSTMADISQPSIDATNPGSSAEPPVPEIESEESVKIHAFSDMNVDTSGTYSQHTTAIVKHMISTQPKVILGIGDYIDGEKTSLSDSTYVSMWNSFTKKVLSLIDISRIPFAPTPGNHDAYYNQEREIYQDYWDVNKPDLQFADDRNYPFYYSFVKEGVFFVSLDDAKYGSLKNRTAQLNWLKEQLSSAQARSAKARVVYGHIPLYSIVSSSANSSTVYENGVIKGERRVNGSFTLESILLSYNVDLVIFGHSHGFYAGHYVYPDGKKLMVVSTPCAGGSQRYLIGTSIKTPQGFVEIEIAKKDKISLRYLASTGKSQSLNSLPNSITLDAKNKIKYEKVKILQ